MHNNFFFIKAFGKIWFHALPVFKFAPLCFTFLFERSKRYASFCERFWVFYLFFVVYQFQLATANLHYNSSNNNFNNTNHMIYLNTPRSHSTIEILVSMSFSQRKLLPEEEFIIIYLEILCQYYQLFWSDFGILTSNFGTLAMKLFKLVTLFFCCIFSKLDMFLLYVMLF